MNLNVAPERFFSEALLARVTIEHVFHNLSARYLVSRQDSRSRESLSRLDQAIVAFLIRAINDFSTSFAETSVQLRLKHDGRLNLN